MKSCPRCQLAIADDARFCGACGNTIASTQEVSHAGQPSSSAAEAPSLIGREIAGRYRVNAKLGEGGMGAVYKAEQISLKRTVAVKLLRPEMASSQMLLARFNAEAQAVAKLSHPNTVNIYDFGQDSDGSLFIAMEYIEGASLRHVIHAEAPLPLRRALHIAAQIAASLSDAHAASIVHRDLKPDNVMLQGRGKQRDVVRVLDFGIAKLRDEGRQTQMAMTQAGDMLGTPQYMAPEQIRAEQIDGRTDVYALGCMLYEMVTGRLPFEAPTVMALLSKHLLEAIVAPSQRRPELGVPPAIDHLILAAMSKDPAGRPATMELMGEHISALLATLPVGSSELTAQVAAQSSALAMSTPTPAPFVPPGAITAAATPPPGHPAYQAPPYDPHAGRVAPMPPPPAKKSSSSLVWIVLGALVLAGTGAGIYFGAIKKDTATQGSGAEPGSDEPGSDENDPGSATPPPDPGSAAPDPWAGGAKPPDPWNKPSSTNAPAGSVAALQGIHVVLPSGFTAADADTDEWLATNLSDGIAIAMMALPPGTDDGSALIHAYATENSLQVLKEDNQMIAGTMRRMAALTGTNLDEGFQAVVPLIGPGFRVLVVFHFQRSALVKNPKIGALADDFFAHNIFLPTP